MLLKALKLANKQQRVIIRFHLAKCHDLNFDDCKQKNKLAELTFLSCFTLAYKHSMIQMAVCMAWQEQRPYLLGNLCAANTASYHPSSTRLMRELKAWIKSKIVMPVSCSPSGWVCSNYFNATLSYATLKLSKQRWSLCLDTCVGPRFPNYLVYLEHLHVMLQWKLLFLINVRTALQRCI